MGHAISSSRHRTRALFLLAAVCALLLATIVFLGPRLLASKSDTPISNPTDFRAFYCGGAVVLAGRDPYRAQPLMACEQHALDSFGLHMIANFVLPAPLPPYALAAFAVLAVLPFPIASIFWCALSTLAVAVTILGVARLVRLPLGVVAAALLGADAYASLVIGQIVPLVVCALVGAALALRAGRNLLATLAFGVAAIEPHIALPAILAAFVIVPRMRAYIVTLAAMLAAISLASVGPTTCVEYLSSVLPAHARSEVAGFGAQYSLTALLYAFGISELAAIRIGEFAYAGMTVVAVALAARLAMRAKDPAYVVLVPAAFAPLGGVFVHIHQMAAAVPLALLLLARSGRTRALAICAVVALAVPWESIAETPAVVQWYARGHVYASPRLPLVRANALAEEPEDGYMRAGGSYYDGRTRAEMLLWKAPTWFALIDLFGATFAFAFAFRPLRGARTVSLQA